MIGNRIGDRIRERKRKERERLKKRERERKAREERELARTKHEKYGYMRNVDHPNVPGAGMRKASDPIRDEQALQQIKANLKARNPRDYCLFIFGINTGIRAGDILKIKLRDVYYLQPGDTFKIREGKTKKWNTITINKEVYQALWFYIHRRPLMLDDPLFSSLNSADKKAISVKAIRDLMKEWTSEVGLRGNYGAHSLRKTFGYWQRVKYNVPWEVLSMRFNHKDLHITKTYLGITEEEMAKVMMNEI